MVHIARINFEIWHNFNQGLQLIHGEWIKKYAIHEGEQESDNFHIAICKILRLFSSRYNCDSWSVIFCSWRSCTRTTKGDKKKKKDNVLEIPRDDSFLFHYVLVREERNLISSELKSHAYVRTYIDTFHFSLRFFKSAFTSSSFNR